MSAKKKKKVNKLPVILLILVIFVAVAAFFWSNLEEIFLLNNDRDTTLGDSKEEAPFGTGKDSINLLLLGADTGSDVDDSTGRSDVIILMNLNFKYKTINGISIPRDTKVSIPGYNDATKINHAYNHGGVELTIDTVEQLMGVPVDYYAETDFDGFKEIIDILDGVTVDVDKRMKYHTYNGTIDLQLGVQKLDGEQALGYVRYRQDPLGDITRVTRQQKLLFSVAQEMTQPANLIKLPRVIDQLSDYMRTDLSAAQQIALAKAFIGMDFTNNVNFEVLPGGFDNSYWGPDNEKITALVAKMFAEIPPQEVARREAAAKAAETENGGAETENGEAETLD